MVLVGLKGFDWDQHNVGHVTRHHVDPEEVEAAVWRPHVIVPARAVGDEIAGRCSVRLWPGVTWSSCSQFGMSDFGLSRHTR
jgi:hypothetical protein